MRPFLFELCSVRKPLFNWQQEWQARMKAAIPPHTLHVQPALRMLRWVQRPFDPAKHPSHGKLE